MVQSFETRPFGSLLRMRITIFQQLTLMLRSERSERLEA
jgi:hypothetical protein